MKTCDASPFYQLWRAAAQQPFAAASICILLSSCTIVPMEDGTRSSPKPPPPPEPVLVLPPLPAQVASDVEPELIRMQEPAYPEAAREAGQEGTVFCDVLVSKAGTPLEVRVAKGVSPALDEAAVAAARTALFEPALKDGAPVSVWMRVPIEFKLHS